MIKSLRTVATRGGQAAILLLTLAGGVAAGPAMAYPAFAIEREFFSDATFNDPVGGRGITCGGNQWHWGVETEFVIYYSESCDRPRPHQF